MAFETLLVMVIGIASLTGLRLLLAVIGKGHAADHPQAPRSRVGAADGSTLRVVRGTGRSRNLMYFVTDEEAHRAAADTQKASHSQLSGAARLAP